MVNSQMDNFNITNLTPVENNIIQSKSQDKTYVSLFESLNKIDDFKNNQKPKIKKDFISLNKNKYISKSTNNIKKIVPSNKINSTNKINLNYNKQLYKKNYVFPNPKNISMKVKSIDKITELKLQNLKVKEQETKIHSLTNKINGLSESKNELLNKINILEEMLNNNNLEIQDYKQSINI